MRPTVELGDAERATLLEVAGWAIDEGLRGRRPAIADLSAHAAALCMPAACFVTLELRGELRGCIGSLERVRPLIVDTAENAYAAAYRDPRFGPVTLAERVHIDIHISVLSEPEPLAFVSEVDLLRQLRPGIDGLILTERGRHGTFLPAVWQTVDDPSEFLAQLKVKAGLAPNYWSDSIRVARYTTLSIP